MAIRRAQVCGGGEKALWRLNRVEDIYEMNEYSLVGSLSANHGYPQEPQKGGQTPPSPARGGLRWLEGAQKLAFFLAERTG
ncbi:MAG: hypothetical protein WB623_15905, partial [Candidatus Sulfotelmatobacter sp.]